MRRLLLPWLALLLVPAGRPAAQGPVVEDRFDVTTCDVLEASGESCGRVRFGWADCPGQRGVPCDVCYSPSGRPFAYVKRTNQTYRLSSGCERLEEMPAEDVYLIAWDPEDAERWEDKGVECAEQRGELICQKPPGASKRPGPSKPPPLTPAQIAAREIRRQWQKGKGGPSFSYAAVPFGAKRKVTVQGKVQEVPRTLHAVEVRGSFEVAYDPKGQPVAGHVAARGAAGGVTGTFFHFETQRPAGPVFSGTGKDRKVVARRTYKTVVDSKTKEKKAVPVPRSFLGLGKGGLFVRDLPTEPEADFQKAFQDLKDDPELQGLGGMGRLLRGGKDALGQARGEQGLVGQSGDSPDARVVAGIDAGGSRLFLLVQEGDDLAKTGAGTRQLGEVLQALGATDAVILDGGGSAQISIPSLGVEYRGDGRRQPTAILFR